MAFAVGSRLATCHSMYPWSLWEVSVYDTILTLKLGAIAVT